MNNFKLFIFFTTFSLVLEPACNVRRLDRTNQSECSQVCAMFEHPDIYQATSHSPTDIAQRINQSERAVFIAESLDGQQPRIAGVLIAVYRVNALGSWGRVLSLDALPNSPGHDDAILFEIIATHPDFRNLGVATKLMGHVQSYAVERKVPNLVLSVFMDNHKAIACYEKQGFKYWRDGCYQVLDFYKRLS